MHSYGHAAGAARLRLAPVRQRTCAAMAPTTAATTCSSPAAQRQISPTRSSDTTAGRTGGGGAVSGRNSWEVGSIVAAAKKAELEAAE